jgi:hypothetical protein
MLYDRERKEVKKTAEVAPGSRVHTCVEDD